MLQKYSKSSPACQVDRAHGASTSELMRNTYRISRLTPCHTCHHFCTSRYNKCLYPKLRTACQLTRDLTCMRQPALFTGEASKDSNGLNLKKLRLQQQCAHGMLLASTAVQTHRGVTSTKWHDFHRAFEQSSPMPKFPGCVIVLLQPQNPQSTRAVQLAVVRSWLPDSALEYRIAALMK